MIKTINTNNINQEKVKNFVDNGKEISIENLAIIQIAKKHGVKIRQKRWHHAGAYWYFDIRRHKWFNQRGKCVNKYKKELSYNDLELFREEQP